MISACRVINVPKRGVGPSTVDKIQAYAAQNDKMFDALAVDFIGLSKSNTSMYFIL